MSIKIWLSFLLASMALCFTPGPTIFLIMGQSLNHGSKSTLPLVSGVLCGDIIAMAVSFAGLGVLLSTSAVLFIALKWLAAAYLVYLGIKAWRSPVHSANIQAPNMPKNRIFREAMLVTALNPKGIVFFIAFFPLFIDTNKAALPQMLTMALTFLLVSATSSTCYASGAGYLRNRVKSTKFQSIFNKTSDTMLMGAGAVTASLNK